MSDGTARARDQGQCTGVDRDVVTFTVPFVDTGAGVMVAWCDRDDCRLVDSGIGIVHCRSCGPEP